jgi:hypothetical protein
MNPRRALLHEPEARAHTLSSAAGGTNTLAGGELIVRVRDRWGAVIREACRFSSVPPAFLGALAANESAGDPQALRFEPGVYGHLTRVAEGKSPRYGSVTRARMAAEVADILSPKSPAFHAEFLTLAFASAHAARLAQSPEEALRELATSWGLTQIMGYHMVGRAGTPRDLLEPRFHFRVALELLAEFAERYQLNLARDFEPMLRCWNTGQPYGATSDPSYVENGLRRMELYHCEIG